jgi:uncharacterized protein YodC (DUF2158 family)
MPTHHKFQFNVGDRVRLRTGGPTMTVESLLDEPGVPVVYYCVWGSDPRNRVDSTADKLELVVPKPENAMS